MSATAGQLANTSRNVLNLTAVDDVVSTDLTSQSQLVVVDINSDNLGTENLLSVLNSQVAQTASAVSNQPLTRANQRLLDCLVGGHTSAGNGASLRRVKALGNLHSVISGHQGVLAHGAVDGVAGVLHRTAQGLAARGAVLAVAAALKEPSHRHAIAHLQGLNTLADLDDTTDALVSQNTTRHLTEITGSHVQVSVAHARVFNLHERLAVTDSRNGNLANLNRTVNLLRDNNSLHGFLAHNLNSLVIGCRAQAAICAVQPSGVGADILYISTVQ